MDAHGTGEGLTWITRAPGDFLVIITCEFFLPIDKAAIVVMFAAQIGIFIRLCCFFKL